MRGGDRQHRALAQAANPGECVSPASSARLRAIPSVDKVLLALGDAGIPRAATVAVVRRELAALRKAKQIPDFEGVLSTVRSAIQALAAARIRPVLNATGIVVHTNFGRSPLGTEVMDAAARVGTQYNNLEYDLGGGARGGRAAYLEHNLALLCDAEAATVVNNNAAALVLILRHFCNSAAPARAQGRKGKRAEPVRKNEVIISRGELVQIGGGFRIPDILESSGARLREIGTTNKTSLADYTRAISEAVALILKVHQSNFFMSGFVESPTTEEIAAVARKKRVPFVEDLGSGAMIDTSRMPGLEHEPTPAEVLRRGVDLVCFSGDKLLGGPQVGIVAGSAKLVAALKRDPLFRALRCDKLILAALQATVDIYLGGHGVSEAHSNSSALVAGIPILEMLSAPIEELRARAEKIVEALTGTALKAAVGTGQAQVGGGALPRSVISSITVDITHSSLSAQDLSARLRARELPMIGYIERGRLKLDLRTILPRQDAELIDAIRAVI
jgi:L-seryl-tRNA(Ser) seleniumtransferase